MNLHRVARFWEELRQRRMIRIFVAYLAGAWVVLQVTDQLVTQGLLPGLAYDLAIVACITGVPASLIVGWFHGEKGRQKVSAVEMVLLGLVLLGGLGAGAAVIQAGTKASLAEVSEMDLRRIGVLYFEDLSSGDSLRHVADGLTESLIDELHAVPNLDVVSRNGMARYRDSDLPRDSIARALQTGTLVAGSVEPEGDRIRATVRLVDGSSGTDIERASLAWPMEEILTARHELAAEASRLLRQWLGEEVQLRTRRRETGSATAWTLVQRAERLRKEAEARVDEGDREGALSAFARSDSVLSVATEQDTAWTEPLRLQGWNDYRRSRLAFRAQELEETVDGVDRAIAHADRALQLDDNDARVLELRGTARYWKSLLPMTSDPQVQQRLVDSARADLERAVRIDPSLARAHSTLSHLYWGQDITEAVLAARKAYEEDAYLRDIELVMWRLFLGSHDLAQFQQARRWCDQGAERFPESFWFAHCQLLMLTTPATEPNVQRAWQLAARLDSLGAPPLFRLWGRILVGGVIGRAGMPDSANRVFLSVRDSAGPEVDPSQELVGYEAAMRAVLGQEEQAIDLLQRWTAANPANDFEEGGQLSWWWRDLQDHPEFQRLLQQ